MGVPQADESGVEACYYARMHNLSGPLARRLSGGALPLVGMLVLGCGSGGGGESLKDSSALGGTIGDGGGTVRLDGQGSADGVIRLDAGAPRVDANSDAPFPTPDSSVVCVSGDQRLPITADMLSASSSYANYLPITAFDGDLSQNSGWSATGGEQKAWLAVDFGAVRPIRRVRVFPDRYLSTDPSYSFLDRFRVDVWANAGWITAVPLLSTPEEKWYEVAVNAETQKLRIWAESDGNGPQIKEVEIYAVCAPSEHKDAGADAAVSPDLAKPVADTAQAGPDMAPTDVAPRGPDVSQPGFDACSGEAEIPVSAGMLSASSSYSSYVPITAFDGDLSQNSGWSASGGEKTAWLVVDFGSVRSLTHVRVFPDRYISTDPSYSYLDRFRVDVWTNSSWVAASALVATPEEKWYEVAVSASTQKLRIWAESDGNGPQIKEIKILGAACLDSRG